MKRIKTITLLAALGAILCAAAWGQGGSDALVWNGCLVALGLTGLTYLAATPRRRHAPPIERTTGIAAALLFAYVLFQLLPLPLPLLGFLTPARLELTKALAIVRPQWAAPISVMPAQTLSYLLRMAAFALMYLLAREAAWRLGKHAWFAVAPLFAAGIFEAWAGLVQVSSLSAKYAVGTYVNRDLYGGFFEMLVPFPALLALVLISQRRDRAIGPRAFAAAFLGAAAVLILFAAALLQSLSRMSVMAALFGLLFAAGVYAAGSATARSRWIALALAGGFVLAVGALAPQKLLSRFAEFTKPGQLDAERLPIWKENFRLIAAYPVTGCGLGCRRQAYLRYKDEMLLYSTDYGHNDYLQALAELGIPGFAIALAAAASLFRETLRGARTRIDPSARLLALACVAAMIALALHGLVDFNLHQPSNMLLLACIAGLGSAAGVERDRLPPAADRVIDLVRTA